jgi:hypothetical protein
MPYGINHEIRNLLRAVQLMYDFFSSEWLDRFMKQQVTFREVIYAYTSCEGLEKNDCQ